ncbi:hypothetical protein PC113_g21454 [Phytophthora cactorum]|uniref:Uncharacterized protein n=1 Tax=Phytophthora cactorum TaxID=29920 RepID=A0A8T0Y0K6_9STRA|nr:hypothetical protein PC113_g21454 [Phytophthora cactorum]
MQEQLKRKRDDDLTKAEEAKSLGAPLFTPVVPPRITSTSHSALVKWKMARAEYEEKVRARSKGSDDAYDQLAVGVKSKIEDNCWTLCIPSSVKNDAIPDIDLLFKKELRMDMRETDVSERVLQYFMRCDALIAGKSLIPCFDTENGQKEKCKLLIESLTPKELQTDAKNAIRFRVPCARSHRQKLHDLVLEKALEQDQHFRRHKRVKYDEQFDRTEKPDKLNSRRGHSARRALRRDMAASSGKGPITSPSAS